MDMILFILIIVSVYACVLTILYNKELKHKTPSALEPGKYKEVLDDALKNLNCKPQWESTETGPIAIFNYQSNYFKIDVNAKNPYVNVIYMGFYETIVENIDIVRDLCNGCTSFSENEKIVYTIDGPKNTVSIHILSSIVPTAQGTDTILEDTFQKIFAWRNVFSREFDKRLNERQNSSIRDRERTVAMWSRLNFLINEHEINSQPKNINFREKQGDRLRLSSIVHYVSQDKSVKLDHISIFITGEEEKIVSDAEETDKYEITESLIRENKKAVDSATFVMNCTSQSLPDRKITFVMNARYEGGGESSMYYRLSFMQVPIRKDSVCNNEKIISFVIAYDLDDEKKNYYEFLYLWKEAADKKKKGETLSMEERLITFSEDENTAYYLYKGINLFLEHRYYEAEPYLKKVYDYLINRTDQLNKSGLETLFEVSFMLGTSYCDIKDYDRAMTFLSITLNSEDMDIPVADTIRYKKEYINCLVNNSDNRAYAYVNGLIKQIEVSSHEQELPKNWMLFLKFLKRRFVQILINESMFDEAEEELKKMLDDTYNKDFALKELALLQKSRKGNDL